VQLDHGLVEHNATTTTIRGRITIGLDIIVIHLATAKDFNAIHNITWTIQRVHETRGKRTEPRCRVCQITRQNHCTDPAAVAVADPAAVAVAFVVPAAVADRDCHGVDGCWARRESRALQLFVRGPALIFTRPALGLLCDPAPVLLGSPARLLLCLALALGFSDCPLPLGLLARDPIGFGLALLGLELLLAEPLRFGRRARFFLEPTTLGLGLGALPLHAGPLSLSLLTLSLPPGLDIGDHSPPLLSFTPFLCFGSLLARAHLGLGPLQGLG
jgi:hypothetical protein